MATRKFGPHTSDKELVVAFQQGDLSAYEEMYRRHSARIRQVCYRLLGNASDAEEATQETFLRGYIALDRFNGRYQLRAWLSRIATNACLDELRSRQRKPEDVEFESDTHSSIDKVQPTDDRVATHMKLTQTLTEIQPLHSKALLMRAMGGLSHQEIAGELEISPQQAKALLHRARSSFRRAWQEASGFVLAPFTALRGLMNGNRDPQVSGFAVAAPAVATTAERVATGAVAVVLAVSGFNGSMTKIGSGPSAPYVGGAFLQQVAPEGPNQRKQAHREMAEYAAPIEGEAGDEPSAVDRLTGVLATDVDKPHSREPDERDDKPRDEGPISNTTGQAGSQIERKVEDAEETVGEIIGR
jgi:RNA polymerase sigma-70 factor (ECF subfamily)